MADPSTDLIQELLDERERAGVYWYMFEPRVSPTCQRLMAMEPEEQRAFVVTAIGWLSRREPSRDYGRLWFMWKAMVSLLRRRLPLRHDDVIALIEWSLANNLSFGTAQIIKAVENYLKNNEMTPELREKIRQLSDCLGEHEYTTADRRRWSRKLGKLVDLKDEPLPIIPGEAWSDAVIEDANRMDQAQRSAWTDLLNLCAEATGSKPSARWSKETNRLAEEIGFSELKCAVLRWFPLVDRLRTRAVERQNQWMPDPNQMIEDRNADILKGLVWLCVGREDKQISRALTALAISTYRKVPQVGPRCVRVGNACVWALGSMPGTESIGQLALLKVRVKFGTAQKGIEKALNTAAEKAGIPREEIEEMSVPSYGITEVGVRRESLGEFTAELTVTGTSATELRWIKPDGKHQKSIPKAVKEGQANKLKELKQAAKDIQKMLPAQRDRIESLYLERKSWSYSVWRERYLDHPLVGTLARRLIWKFASGEQTAAGVFHEGRILNRNGNALDWLDTETKVELWHPIGESTNEVLSWRDWLAELEIKQPFKQAHREVYLLTDAERNTRTYSNRFAAHVLKQHQFNALCAARGWKNKLRMMVDDDYPPALRPMTAYDLRAEFWVEGAGEAFGVDTNESGTYLYLSTDQVRFYPIQSRVNYAHAGGGGYAPGYYGQGMPVEPLALEEVPSLVFSEVMRDADLFVGVASVGNDPNWADGGPEGRYRNYWTSYAFGYLTDTAKTRKQVLERLVPRLKISDRCQLEDRFLIVRGEVRTYRIHLGSGNILMEPNGQYLCIVPSQGGNVSGKVFLPFEGDRTLAIILSKAFLLADDTKIEDPTILSQIRR